MALCVRTLTVGLHHVVPSRIFSGVMLVRSPLSTLTLSSETTIPVSLSKWLTPKMLRSGRHSASLFCHLTRLTRIANPMCSATYQTAARISEGHSRFETTSFRKDSTNSPPSRTDSRCAVNAATDDENENCFCKTGSYQSLIRDKHSMCLSQSLSRSLSRSC